MTVPYPEASQQSAESPAYPAPPSPPGLAFPPEEDALFYHISFDRLAGLNRSPIALLVERRGPDAPSRLRPDHELNDPRELLAEIAEFADEEDDFIQSNMPLQEIVFRMLLARRNQPTALSELHYELTERWSTPVRPINVTLANLRRILDGDTYYGFARAAN